MRVYDLKEYLYDVIERYFHHANVVWSDEVRGKPTLPLVRLTLRNLSGAFYTNDEPTEDDILQYQPSTITLEVNTFIKLNDNAHDDSVPDLNEFVKYLCSVAVVDELFSNDLTIYPAGPIQSVNQVLSGEHELHALAEFTVNFTQLISGLYGIKSDVEPRYNIETKVWVVQDSVSRDEWKPTTSGGGSYDMDTAGNYYITEVTNIKEE